MPDPRDDETLNILMPPGAPGPAMPAPFSSLVRVDIGARSDRGKRRPNNEDAYIVFRTARTFERIATNLSEPLPEQHAEVGWVFAVADGMGGMAAGDVASSLAIRAGVALALGATKWNLKLDSPETRAQEIQETLDSVRTYMRAIHERVSEHARSDPKLAGMGTTFTAAFTVGADLFTFHVGDSRAYLYRGGALRQLTKDDTLAQLLADSGRIAPEHVSQHQWRHVLTEAMGGRGEDVQVQVQHHEMQDGDVLLLCSDGLTDEVVDTDLAATLSRDVPAQTLCEALIDLALERGGRDNATALVARYTIPPRR
jgi:serine/threonine protein phosphatase PrpC